MSTPGSLPIGGLVPSKRIKKKKKGKWYFVYREMNEHEATESANNANPLGESNFMTSALDSRRGGRRKLVE